MIIPLCHACDTNRLHATCSFVTHICHAVSLVTCTFVTQLADDLVRSPDKLATENIFILTVEMHKKVAARSFIFTFYLGALLRHEQLTVNSCSDTDTLISDQPECNVYA